MKRFAAKHGFTFPDVIDETQNVARAYNAQSTPDFFGFMPKANCSIAGDLMRRAFSKRQMLTATLFFAMKQTAETGRGPG